jgi:Domain of unknown function (DUF4258)
VPKAFDFTTSQILDWELEKIHDALIHEEIDVSDHARKAARDDKISPVDLLAAILVGIPVSKDLPDNNLKRVAGINFEHRLHDKRWIRVKIAFINNYIIITAYQI